jgi:DNA mismatch endonuclease, patch repair protein
VRSSPSFAGYSPSSKISSRAKQRTPSRDTRAELSLRRALHARGLRYRVNVHGIVGNPDIVFAKKRVIVFCDGDFFHGKDWPILRRKLVKRANSSYWIEKIAYNRRRDRRVGRVLERAGWRVLRFWASEIDADVQMVARHVEAAIREGY